MMPGLINPMIAAGGVTSLAMQASATSESSSVTAPSSVQAGDLLVLWDFAGGLTGPPSSVIPTGFTEIVDFSLNAQRAIASHKIADGSEAGASITGMGGLVKDKCLYVFRGDQAIASASSLDIASEGTTGTPASQIVNASTGASPLIVFGCYAATDTIGGRTFSPASDGEINSSEFCYLAYKIYNSNPADVTVGMDDVDTNFLASFYIQCS